MQEDPNIMGEIQPPYLASRWDMFRRRPVWDLLHPIPLVDDALSAVFVVDRTGSKRFFRTFAASAVESSSASS